MGDYNFTGQYFVATLQIVEYFLTELLFLDEKTLREKVESFKEQKFRGHLAYQAFQEQFTNFKSTKKKSMYDWKAISKRLFDKKDVKAYQNKLNLYQKDLTTWKQLEKDQEELNKYLKDLESSKFEIHQNCQISPRLTKLLDDMEMDLFQVNGVKDGSDSERICFYYLFFLWHKIDVDKIEKAYKDEEKDKANLIYSLQLLNPESIHGVQITELKNRLHHYFYYFLKLLSNKEAINNLELNYLGVWEFYSHSYSLLSDLIAVRDRFYIVGSEKKNQILEENIETEFSAEFRNIIKESETENLKQIARNKDELVSDLIESWTEITENYTYSKTEMEILRERLLDMNLKSPKKNAEFYPTFHEIKLENLKDKVAYLSIIDSSQENRYQRHNFNFKPEDSYEIKSLNFNEFNDLLDRNRFEVLNNGKAAQNPGKNEEKFFVYNIDEQKSNNNLCQFIMKIRPVSYATGVARRELFLRDFVPTELMLKENLVYLLKENRLESFLGNCNDKNSIVIKYIQQKFDQRINSEKNSTYASEFIEKWDIWDAGDIKMITTELRNKFIALYESHISGKYTKNTNNEKWSYQIVEDIVTTFSGCGTFIITKDNRLLLEKRDKVIESNGNAGYPSAGSCDYYVSKDKEALVKQFEADPFQTAVREMFEEVGINIYQQDLVLISFGVDVSRNLQQFSFYIKSDLTAEEIFEKKKSARDRDEGKIFSLPFNKKCITDFLNIFELEPCAVYSAIKLMELEESLLK